MTKRHQWTQTFWIITFVWHQVSPKVSLPPVDHASVDHFLRRADQWLKDQQKKFGNNSQAELVPGTPAWFMGISHSMKKSVVGIAHMAMVLEEATRSMAEAYALSNDQITFGLPQMDMTHTDMGKICPLVQQPPCRPRKYRAFSGYCNNNQNPKWANSNERYSRLLPPDYEDGISIPRGGGVSSPFPLPSAREVSLAVHRGEDLPHKHVAAIAALWGQFIANDLSYTPIMAGDEGLRFRCCSVNIDVFHPECFPVRNPENDPVYSGRCQEFTRSAPSVRTGCTLGPRDQINQVTAFLDGSTIYGSEQWEADRLREFRGGRMIGQENRDGLLLPTGEGIDCRNRNLSKCFLSGDLRVNQNIGLASVHTLWLREHNRIAAELEWINSDWNDETVFQEARRIVIAELQHITYYEFLPAILGETNVNKYKINVQQSDYFEDYDIDMNPNTINSVAHAALLFIITLMPDVIPISKSEKMSLMQSFYAPSVLYEPNGFDKVITGLLDNLVMKDDNVVNHAMMNDMYKDPSFKGNGLDMVAQIIQRGRDHGLPSYSKWRKFCNLQEPQSFEDLLGYVPKQLVKALQIYKNVSDIDLFTGGLCEISEEGSVIGPTFTCLLGHQFYRTKTGDRHWYENNIPPSSFTEFQLKEIRKVSLARIICDNSNVWSVQPKVFLMENSFLNYKMSCSNIIIPKMDLSKWGGTYSKIYMDIDILEDAISQAKVDLAKIVEEENLPDAYIHSRSIETAYKFNRPKRQAHIIANTSLLLQLATTRLMNEYMKNLQDSEENQNDLSSVLSDLTKVDISNVIDLPMFPCDDADVPCDHTSKYRTVTGRCNNLQNLEYGKSMRPFNRLLLPAYDDGIGSPRKRSITGKPLPSARLISTHIHPDTSTPHPRYSLMLMQFAQILDHELTHTPVNSKHLGLGILNCSPCDTKILDCIPITIPKNDPYFPNAEKCIPVTRSLPSRLTLGHREQMNQVTAYVDGSFIYGSDLCEMKQLRFFFSGKMNVTHVPNKKPLMPEISTNPECRSHTKVCFRAGDARASEQPGLASLQTIFLREHNRIAEQLEALNPHWSDEIIYQETRRIVGAMIQHIAFAEFLPRVFGWDHLKDFELSLTTDGYFEGYDPTCDATLINEFSSAAFRFGHSLLRPVFIRMNSSLQVQNPDVRLHDHFFNPELLYERNMVDELITGLVNTPMETLDRYITQEVTNHLFEDEKTPFSGMDLPAINIQRARDHGISGYNSYRQFCNMSRALEFQNLIDLIPGHIVTELERLYDHVDDIDLFPGGLVETPLKGGIIGPTFACIIGHQFKRLKKCDRYWYETNDPVVRFTKDQLNEIKNTVLARILCDNLDNIKTIQRQVLDLPEPYLNPRVDCKEIKKLNLDSWKEKNKCIVQRTVLDVGFSKNTSPCTVCTCTKEGAICKSVKVTDCLSLSRHHSWDTILSNPVCKVQCAHVYAAMKGLN